MAATTTGGCAMMTGAGLGLTGTGLVATSGGGLGGAVSTSSLAATECEVATSSGAGWFSTASVLAAGCEGWVCV